MLEREKEVANLAELNFLGGLLFCHREICNLVHMVSPEGVVFSGIAVAFPFVGINQKTAPNKWTDIKTEIGTLC